MTGRDSLIVQDNSTLYKVNDGEPCWKLFYTLPNLFSEYHSNLDKQ